MCTNDMQQISMFLKEAGLWDCSEFLVTKQQEKDEVGSRPNGSRIRIRTMKEKVIQCIGDRQHHCLACLHCPCIWLHDTECNLSAKSNLVLQHQLDKVDVCHHVPLEIPLN